MPLLCAFPYCGRTVSVVSSFCEEHERNMDLSVREEVKPKMDVLEAYRYMRKHDLLDLIDIHYVLVNPETLKIDFNQSKNTKLQVWLEFGRSEMGDVEIRDNAPRAMIHYHYWQLDSSGDTFEEALIESATRAKRFFEEGWNPFEDEEDAS